MELTKFSPDAPPSLVGPEVIENLLTLATNCPPGCYVELGVYRGGVAWHLARLADAQERELHLFDTFCGIPTHGPYDLNHRIGDFGDTSEIEVRAAIPSAVFHVGVFPDTMPDNLPPIAFCHVDCDQYDGSIAAITHFWPKMVTGGIMLWDDYGATSGVIKAVNETWRDVPCTPYGKAYIIKD